MNSPRLIRMLAAGTALLSALVAFPVAAVAVSSGPPTAPVLIKSESFETANTPGWQFVPEFELGVAPKAYWGRMTNSSPVFFPVGTAGLWCAGSGGNYWASKYYTYWTRGAAVWTLPETGEYYRTTIDYLYYMPSIGGADGFYVNYASTAAPSTSAGIIPVVNSAWQRVTLPLSLPVTNPLQDVNLSRSAGTFKFRFYDNSEGERQAPNGLGPLVDDVNLRGFRYGPVRNLRAGAAAGNVTLSWSEPASSTADASPDTRAKSFRVWRKNAGVWTELTSETDRVVYPTREYVDTSPAGGSDYYVQAWAPGIDTTSWGELAAPVSVSAGTLTGIVKSGSTPLDGVSVQVTGGPSTTTGPDGSYTIPGMVPGSAYEVTFSKEGYLSRVENGVAIVGGTATTLDPVLSADGVSASIVWLLPKPVTVGQPVQFKGTGSDSSGHGIVAYEWKSSISGVFSESAESSCATLPTGTHTISFRVRCANDNWSMPAVTTLVVNPEPPLIASTPDPIATGIYGLGVAGSNRRGKAKTFSANITPGPAAMRGTAKVAFYRYETKTVRKKVRGRWKRVKVKYWRLRAAPKSMSATDAGRVSTTYTPRYAGSWKMVVTYTGVASTPGVAGYANAGPAEKTFKVK